LAEDKEDGLSPPMTNTAEHREYELRVWRNGEHVMTESFATFDEMDARMQSLLLSHDGEPEEYRMRAYHGDGLLGEITNR
jgi:hypothetical protein